jgi:hypothetical protein
MNTGTADRFGPLLAFAWLLLVLVLGAALDAEAVPIAHSANATTQGATSVQEARVDAASDAALLQRVHTNGMADVCGEHPDVAPTVQLVTYRALLAALRAEPRLRGEACRIWRSYREI